MLIMFNNRVHFMYNDEPAAGTGEPSGEPPAQSSPDSVPPDSGGMRRGQKPTNMKEFLGKAKVMNKPPTREGQEPGEPSPEPAQGEPAEKNTLVRGPGSQQPESKPGDPKPGEEPPEQGEPEPKENLVKIGDLEYPADSWIQGLKDSENRKNWQANLTKKSQIINKFPDDIINDLAPYALGQRELPKDFKAELAKELPDIEIENEDGYTEKISADKLPDDFLNSVKQKVLASALPEYIQLQAEHEALKVKHENLAAEVEAERLDEGVSATVDFMLENPDYAVTYNEGEDLAKVLAGIIKAGKQHPEYGNATRLGMVLNAVSTGMFKSFKEAAENLNLSRRTTPSEQVNINQSQDGDIERPGKSVNPPTGGKQLLNKMAERGKGARYNQIRKFQ